MKKLLMLMPVVFLLFLAGCVGDNGTSAERQEFRQRMEERIAKFNQQIAEARERSQGLTGQAREDMNQAINELEAQRDNLVAKLAEMGEASSDEWEAAKNEMEEAVNELDQAFSEFRQNFSESFSQFDLRRP